MPYTPLCRFRDISPSRGEIVGCEALSKKSTSSKAGASGTRRNHFHPARVS